MTKKEKAFCGDGVLRCCIGELITGTNIKINFESNSALRRCWEIYSDVKPIRNTNWEFGTLMEAEIYDIFKDHGYDAVKEFILDKVVNILIILHNEKQDRYKNITNKIEIITL